MAGSLRSRIRSAGPWGADGLLALVLVAVGLAELARTGTGDSPAVSSYAGTVLVCVAVAWRRTAPMAVALVVFGGTLTLLASGLDNDNLGHFVAYLLAAYSLGAHTRDREADVRTLAVCFVVLGIGASQFIGFSDGIGFMLLSIGACALGRLVRHRTTAVDELRDETRRLVEAREARAKAAVEEERARIARELHDVVAHTISLMVLQTGAGRKAMRTDPDRADAMLRSAELTGRQATGEMQRLVGLLRTGERERQAQPGLAALDELVSSVRQSGKDVEVVVTGSPGPLPPGVDLAAFRIVQEALTNSLKHAGLSSACVEIDYREHEVHVQVSDEGMSSRLVWPPEESGHGLAGMRERVRLYGGELYVGPTGAGGLRVGATLPTEEVP